MGNDSQHAELDQVDFVNNGGVVRSVIRQDILDEHIESYKTDNIRIGQPGPNQVVFNESEVATETFEKTGSIAATARTNSLSFLKPNTPLHDIRVTLPDGSETNAQAAVNMGYLSVSNSGELIDIAQREGAEEEPEVDPEDEDSEETIMLSDEAEQFVNTLNEQAPGLTEAALTSYMAKGYIESRDLYDHTPIKMRENQQNINDGVAVVVNELQEAVLGRAVAAGIPEAELPFFAVAFWEYFSEEQRQDAVFDFVHSGKPKGIDTIIKNYNEHKAAIVKHPKVLDKVQELNSGSKR